MNLRAAAIEAARRNNLDPDLFLRLIQQESGFQPHVTSSAGAYGPAQLMPGTAADLGVDPRDPLQNLEGGARYLRQQMDTFGDPKLALAAYNAGPGAVRKYGGVPPYQETQNYVASILGGQGGGNVSKSSKGTGMGLLDMPAEQPRTLMDRIRSPETTDNLLAWVNSMRLNPDPNIGSMIENRQARRAEGEAMNRTAQWLRSQGREDLAGAIESGVLGGKEAASLFYQPEDPLAAVNLERAQLELDRLKSGTGMTPMEAISLQKAQLELEQMQGPQPALTGDQLTALNTIRDDVRAELAPFDIVKQGYNNITTFYSNPSGTSDYALAVAFAKILDPGSVAREGEVSAVQNAGARIPALGQAMRNAITGEGALTPEVRQQIAELATQIYSERATSAQTTLQSYGELARQAGVPTEFIYSGEIPTAQAVVPAVVPPSASAAGVTQLDWDAMTQDERKTFLGAQ